MDPNAFACTHCGVAKGVGNNFCWNCGSQVNPMAVMCPACGVGLTPQQQGGGQAFNPATTSPKSRLVALLLCIFLGGLGAHKFYLGKTGMGILYLFTAGLFGIGALIDLIMLITGSAKDGDGLEVRDWQLNNI